MLVKAIVLTTTPYFYPMNPQLNSPIITCPPPLYLRGILFGDVIECKMKSGFGLGDGISFDLERGRVSGGGLTRSRGRNGGSVRKGRVWRTDSDENFD